MELHQAAAELGAEIERVKKLSTFASWNCTKPPPS